MNELTHAKAITAEAFAAAQDLLGILQGTQTSTTFFRVILYSRSQEEQTRQVAAAAETEVAVPTAVFDMRRRGGK